MILTHMVMFGFFSGAGDGSEPAVIAAVYSRIHQGVGLAF